MKHAFPALLLASALGCADSAEIPAFELGGSSGARLMKGEGRTPLESYEIAYSSLHRQHYNVKRNLENRGQSAFAARGAMESILSSLEIMRSAAAPSEQPRFDPYLARYKAWSADLAANRWGGSFLQDVDRSEYELKEKFNPANVEIRVESTAAVPAPSPAPAPAPTPRPPPAAPGVPDDKAVAPDRPALPPPPPGPAPAPAPAPAAGSTRLFYKAWDRSHDDLVAAYKAKKDCRQAYEDLSGALKQFQAGLPADKAGKLQIYLVYYADIHDKTKGFAALPAGEKITEKDIVDELDVAARAIRREFNPDK